MSTVLDVFEEATKKVCGEGAIWLRPSPQNFTDALCFEKIDGRIESYVVKNGYVKFWLEVAKLLEARGLTDSDYYKIALSELKLLKERLTREIEEEQELVRLIEGYVR
ncbi:MAG: hypothetical protein DRJ40_08405 [Thermoprotei archaeon]|nr:MAG: hypothetical protein DRJ40_08405 [Thermoprotei archaeon]